MINLELVPRRKALLADHDNALDVLLRIQAPPAPAGRRARPPLNLALVIDRSGSMSGQPLNEAKRCASMIIDGLSAQDRASLVVYDSDADVLVASRPVDDRTLFQRMLAEVHPGGSTALHAGWVSGAEQAAHGQGGHVLSRVLLLSDGCANVGLRDPRDIARHCGQMAEAGISTSTYGLGQGFNEELMTQMARAGAGNAYYGQTAGDLSDPFREELDLMSALCARNLRLKLSPATGVRVEVVNQYPVDADGRIQLPDLAYDGEVWALLRLTVARSVLETGGPGDIHLLTAALAHVDLEGGRRHAEPIHLRLPSQPAAVFGAIADNDLVVQRATEIAAARLQEQGREAARRGDWHRVRQLLEQLKTIAQGNQWLAAGVARLEAYARRQETESFSKEAHYSAHRQRSRLTSRDEGAAWSQQEEGSKANYLRRKLEQGKRMDDPDNGPPPDQGAGGSSK